LEERGELFILKEKSNHSDLSWNFWLYTKTLFTKKSMGLARKGSQNFQHLSELPATLRAGTSSYYRNFQQLCEPELPAIAGTSSNFASQNFQHFPELPTGKSLQSATKFS
jgi:hypothetical protein